MRIIAGKYGGRSLTRPKTASTRPMSDKVREALFNVVGSVEGWRVLDVYAGSGAIAIEALSRGASQAVVVESGSEPLRAIKASQVALSLGSELTVLAIPAAKALLRLSGDQFELIVADPPYDAVNVAILTKMSILLASGGLLVLSHSGRIAAPTLEFMQRIDTRRYGDSSLSFYRN